ncbi:MAG: biotin/lipoyl-binding protein, partial [Deltaproteobacteria bacterium]|nr:biotin/lipoyl-binding protein [Deltaproteobacteria bacterium]
MRPMKKLLIANRGEIAIRVTEAAAELGLTTVAIFSEDDVKSLHVIRADEARPLHGTGAAAYLDAEQIVAVAKHAGCDAIHPGYGFLSENAGFAQRCAEAGIVFVGPRPELLDLFGDKVRARQLAGQCGVPVLAGSTGPTSLAEVKAFLRSGPADAAIVIKAVAGGGGRGMRIVRRLDDVEEAYNRCQSEARAAFGNGEVYVERFMPAARHIEVQILGDQSGNVTHLWERECTVQRRQQKLIEIAPSPSITPATRDQLVAAAMRMAQGVRYDSLGTFEFLLNTNGGEDATFAFIEANPRLQVEHTVTEEVTGVDLVKAQLQLAAGQSLRELGLDALPREKPRGFAIELRINAESMAEDASVRPSNGTLTVFEAPSGPGLRVDSYAYAGYSTNPRFDSLLAKLIASSPSENFAETVNKAYRALCKFRIEGVATNLGFLQAVLQHADFRENRIHTGFVEEKIAELAAAAHSVHRRLYFERPSPARTVGAKIDTSDPLAVLHLGKSAAPQVEQPAQDHAAQLLPGYDLEGIENAVALRAPMQGTIVSIDANEGEAIAKGQQLIVMEAMKMEHVLAAPVSGILQRVTTAKGDTVAEGQPL